MAEVVRRLIEHGHSELVMAGIARDCDVPHAPAANPVHLATNVAEKGPLPADLYEEAKKHLPLPEIR